MLEEILVPISFFIMIAVIVAVSVWGGVQNKRVLADTLRRAMESGHRLDPETISALQRPVRSRQQDLRGGVILVALAVGLVAAGFLLQGGIPDEEGQYWAGNGMFIAAVIVGAIGAGQLIAAYLTRKPKDADPRDGA